MIIWNIDLHEKQIFSFLYVSRETFFIQKYSIIIVMQFKNTSAFLLLCAYMRITFCPVKLQSAGGIYLNRGLKSAVDMSRILLFVRLRKRRFSGTWINFIRLPYSVLTFLMFVYLSFSLSTNLSEFDYCCIIFSYIIIIVFSVFY